MAAKKKATRRGFVVYKSYLFKEKDPVIDAMRTAVEDSKESYSEISDASGVSASTMYNWFHGNVRRPQFATTTAVVLALGKKGIMFKGGKPTLID